MDNEKQARARLLSSFNRLVEKGYAKASDHDGTGFPVKVIYEKEVPIRGNVHIGMGRTVSSKTIKKEFAR